MNNEDSVKGVHVLNEEIKDILQDKHPKSRPSLPEATLPLTSDPPQPVIYEEITSESVYKIALKMKGSGRWSFPCRL